MASSKPLIGVAIVTFDSADVIAGCLDSLFASEGVDLRVVVTDNRSSDATCEVVRRWAESRSAGGPAFTFEDVPHGSIQSARATLTFVRSPVNGGFAHGINVGLELLLKVPEIDLFWVLNPDCVVTPQAALQYARAGADGRFSLMGGRTVYKDNPDQIQIDGGRVARWTGVCVSLNSGRPPDATPMPPPDQVDFIAGSNMVASRLFLERAGLMAEDYFLYYEEVDWAFRRGDLPLRVVPEVIVYHHGGTSIGTGSTVRRASPFANYFNYRSRIRFVRRFMPTRLPLTLAYAIAKAAQLTLLGGRDEASAILRGTFGLPPPAPVRERIEPGQARALAFGRAL